MIDKFLLRTFILYFLLLLQLLIFIRIFFSFPSISSSASNLHPNILFLIHISFHLQLLIFIQIISSFFSLFFSSSSASNLPPNMFFLLLRVFFFYLTFVFPLFLFLWQATVPGECHGLMRYKFRSISCPAAVAT